MTSRCPTFAALLLMAGLSPVQAAETLTTSSIASVVPHTAKLATRTEILNGRNEPAMLTLSSLRAMDAAIEHYRQIADAGGWPNVSAKRLAPGDRQRQVVVLRQRLAMEGYLPEAALYDESPLFDKTLSAALSAFQGSHGLVRDGRLAEKTAAALNVSAQTRLEMLSENHPRVAAYMEGLGPRAILVNIPSAQLETVVLGTVYSRHNVVVGKVDRPTPTLKSRVSEVNFNPYWNAPQSIVGRDLIPKLIKDPYAMDRMHVRIYDGFSGPEIDPTSVDWTQTPPDRFFFRQDPGSDNSLGVAKINFANDFHVYMHDTPHRELFARNQRFESSGCIRVDRIELFVEWVLNKQNGMTAQTVAQTVASGQRENMRVAKGPDIRVMYLTAWAQDDGRVNFRPDIYNLDGTGFIWGQPGKPALLEDMIADR